MFLRWFNFGLLYEKKLELLCVQIYFVYYSMFYCFISLSASVKNAEPSSSDGNEGKVVCSVYMKIIYSWALFHVMRGNLEFLGLVFQFLFHF